MSTTTDSMNTLAHLPEDPQEQATAMAVAVLVERISGLSKEDRQDLYELMLELPKASSREETADIIRTMREILDQRPVRTVAIDPVKEGCEPTRGLADTWLAPVSERIRLRRTEAGLTQQQLAGRADIPQSHLSRLENGKHSPSRATLDKIAAALELSVSEFDPSAE